MVVKVGNRCVRTYSDMNYWMDALFVIRKESEVDQAVQLVEKAMNKFWEQSSECYGDMIEYELLGAGIEFDSFYIKTDEQGECDADENEYIGEGYHLILRDDKLYLKVGEYVPETDDSEAVIERAFYRQGDIYKNADAYFNRSDEVCYVPELSDSGYTGKDFLDMCCGQKEFADELFEGSDWQHPESLQEDWMRNGEWAFCKKCKKLFDLQGEDIDRCPECGTEFE